MDIYFQDVGFTYQKGTPFESKAIYDIDLSIKDGSFTSIVGHTGSGKSTVLQHLNALKKPTEGTVTIGGRVITNASDNKGLKSLRKKVGIVFQFPEAQLFEETVGKDIAFGPKNFGSTEEEGLLKARELLPLVGLDETFMDRSPFDLSGGQMRRVAIAGVLALEPEVLVLDEPTAGLDPQGRKEIMTMFYDLYKNKGLTIILVTHQMDDVAAYSDHMIVLEKGTVMKEGHPKEIFKEADWLASMQLGVPSTVKFARELEKKFDWTFDSLPLTTDELAEQIINRLPSNGGGSL
ncbi:energy-coupling factor ABC transporter ATP-binding protein [Alkalibacterium kapii]|uniref:Energy-coupling factor transporter ATP-binding protein EcfA2 n=1 Tax=Alkalibacterium kapii TaxID=426704 RepID=A0A511AU65_9LACT|nr:energy-coupling factor ABC transporter ATP-binding protein [Alkalibacterium kapii]GEK91748.1 energy-coupling factor transporter ATP-binding protein EcfA2 [Alkalibacterium kapii]